MFQSLNDRDYGATIERAEKGVVLFVKKLCPHCKNMLVMLEKFQKMVPGVLVYTLDIEDCPAAKASLAAERAPTVYIVKGGKIAARKTGLMNPKEMIAFYETA